jgi:hypothetical protein
MKIRTIMLAAAGGSLISAPVALQAADAAPITRSAMPANAESDLGGGFGAGIVIAALAAAGMLALILTDDDDDDEAVSP